MRDFFYCRVQRGRRPLDSSLLLRDPPDRPDVGLYNPFDALAAGQTATWFNPDIRISGPGRSAEVTVTNFSSTATAVNAVIGISVSPFGIGEPWEPVLQTLVTLPPARRQRILAPVPAHFPPVEPVRIRCDIAHPDDINERNDRGDWALSSVFVTLPGQSAYRQGFWMVNAQPGPQMLTLAIVNGPSDVQIEIPQLAPFAPFERRWVEFELELATFPTDPGNTVFRDVTVVGRDQGGAVIDGLTFNFGVGP